MVFSVRWTADISDILLLKCGMVDFGKTFMLKMRTSFKCANPNPEVAMA
jgi:hypothetical protein